MLKKTPVFLSYIRKHTHPWQRVQTASTDTWNHASYSNFCSLLLYVDLESCYCSLYKYICASVYIFDGSTHMCMSAFCLFSFLCVCSLYKVVCMCSYINGPGKHNLLFLWANKEMHQPTSSLCQHSLN